MLATAYYYDYTEIQDQGSFAAIAGFQYGNNGDELGGDEYQTRNDNNVISVGRKNWAESDPSDAFDSGDVAFTFDAKAGGSVSLSIGNSITGAVSVPATFSSISYISLQAGVMTNASVEFESLMVSFRDASGNETSSFSTGDSPGVDQSDFCSSPTAENIMNVTPAAGTSAAEVVVTGMIHMSAPGGSYPSGNTIFGNICVAG